MDSNGDGRVTANELFGTDWDTGEPTWIRTIPTAGPGTAASIRPIRPVATSTTSTIPTSRPRSSMKLSLSYEKEILADFAVRVEGFYKKRHRLAWDKGIMADGSIETADNWYAGAEPTRDSSTLPTTAQELARSATYRTNCADNAYLQRYLAFEIVLKKRLSNNWMMDGSFTLTIGSTTPRATPSAHDLNNYDYYEGGVVAPQSGGSGITDVFVNSRWMVKLSGLYQFPYGINGCFTFLAREGYVTPPYVQVIGQPRQDQHVRQRAGRRRQVRRLAPAQLLRAQPARRKDVQRHREAPLTVSADASTSSTPPRP